MLCGEALREFHVLISKSEKWHVKFPPEAHHGGFTFPPPPNQCPIQAEARDAPPNA